MANSTSSKTIIIIDSKPHDLANCTNYGRSGLALRNTFYHSWLNCISCWCCCGDDHEVVDLGPRSGSPWSAGTCILLSCESYLAVVLTQYVRSYISSCCDKKKAQTYHYRQRWDPAWCIRCSFRSTSWGPPWSPCPRRHHTHRRRSPSLEGRDESCCTC